MKKRTILLIALAAMAMVGVAGAAEAVDKLEMYGTIVDTAGATWVAGDLHACIWGAYNFAAYVDAISNETNTMQLKYVWLMSDEAIKIDDGDEFGALEVTTADSNMVELKNGDSIALYAGEVIDVCGA